MLKTHENFHAANGKRLILIVDDEEINRELLCAMLEEHFEIVMAENGLRALEIVREKKDMISLVLLDLLMPGMHGLEVLGTLKRDAALRQLPVIVMTSEQSAEVESLQLGAIDFIPKPYPQPEVILARIQRTIELSEDRDIIQSTEREDMTGLFNREFFFRYAEQYDRFHPDQEMDAVALDVNRFHLINEMFGRAA
ncbi:MAG: response regulator, partial [Clostridia bacterium]|nr:response regulator [Clostridia bacterium]